MLTQDDRTFLSVRGACPEHSRREELRSSVSNHGGVGSRIQESFKILQKLDSGSEAGMTSLHIQKALISKESSC
jgi:hypothetical protein